MLIIADKKIPEQAKTNLQKYGDLFLLETKGITAESISGHPDIFFCKTPNQWIIAPNLPEKYKELLSLNLIPYKEGKTNVGEKYPEAASYNAVVTNDYLIHRIDITESEILNNCQTLNKINVNQGFTKCSLLALKNNNFITCDEGIYKTLIKNNINLLLLSSKEILLPGHEYGFLGGCCGIWKNNLFILGSLHNYIDASKLKKFTELLGYTIIELYDGPLFDGGTILFME